MGLITRIFQQNGLNRASPTGDVFADSALASCQLTVSNGTSGSFIVAWTNTVRAIGVNVSLSTGTITILSPGIYTIDLAIATSVQTYAGISVNGTTGSGIANTAPDATVLIMSRTDTSTVPTAVSATAKLVAGDLVRAHIQSSSPANQNYAQFRVTQLVRL